jgi:probable addiction module antidote protein
MISDHGADGPAHTDPAAQLATLEALAAYLAAAFESGDALVLTEALAVAARADGTTHLAAAASLPQAELRQAFASGEMSMGVTLSVMKVIDLHMPGSAH